jgi:hypothetical protein
MAGKFKTEWLTEKQLASIVAMRKGSHCDACGQVTRKTYREIAAAIGCSQRHASRLARGIVSHKRRTGVHGNKGKHWKWDR